MGEEALLGALAEPTAEFARLVRDALVHLYSPAHLLRHPLQACLDLPGAGDPAQDLRNLLIDAIEGMEPPGKRSTGEKESRPYLILVQRYVAGSSDEAIAARLHISPRQVRRELQIGLQALTAYLWARSRRQAPEARTAPRATNLQSELETLGLRLEPVPLAELVASLRSAAESLAHEYSAALSIGATGSTTPLCDRTFAKQAVLSCLSALLEQRPRYLEIADSSAAGAAGLRLTVTPPLSEAQAEDLALTLAPARSLMSAQGGRVSLLCDEGGQCAGLDLTMRVGRQAHVLVVDDNQNMLQLYRRYLAAGRYRVSTATSAHEAEAALAKAVPDAIVVDVMMRDVDGWDLLQGLRARPGLHDVPIVVCSVLDEPKMAQSLGAQAYLKKPVSSRDLLATLQQLLEVSSRAARRPASL